MKIITATRKPTALEPNELRIDWTKPIYCVTDIEGWTLYCYYIGPDGDGSDLGDLTIKRGEIVGNTTSGAYFNCLPISLVRAAERDGYEVDL